MDMHATALRRLERELAVSEPIFERLNLHLGVLHELCTRGTVGLSAVRKDLLASELWTLLGGTSVVCGG